MRVVGQFLSRLSAQQTISNIQQHSVTNYTVFHCYDSTETHPIPFKTLNSCISIKVTTFFIELLGHHPWGQQSLKFMHLSVAFIMAQAMLPEDGTSLLGFVQGLPKRNGGGVDQSSHSTLEVDNTEIQQSPVVMAGQPTPP